MFDKLNGAGKILALLLILSVFYYSFEVYAIETVLKVAYEPNLPPYQFIQNDKSTGLHIDILNYIANKNNFKIKYMPMNTTTKCLEALKSGEVDIVLGVHDNNKLDNDIQFTEDLSESYICIFTTKANSNDILKKLSINNFSAALENDTIKYSYIQNMRNLRYTVTSNQIEAFHTLTSQKVDLLIGVKHSILYQLEKEKVEDDYTIINNYIVPVQYAVAVRKGNNELVEKLNLGIQQLRVSGEYEKIYDKWINEDSYAVKEMIRKVVYAAAVLLTIVLLIFTFNFRLNMLLKRQVNEKTEELQKTNADLKLQIIRTRNYNELNNCIVENSPSGIVVFDRDYTITLFNHNAVKLAKIEEPPIGGNVFDIKLLNDVLSADKDKIFLEGFKFINHEIALKKESGDIVNYRYDIYQLFDSDGNVRSVILTIEDITGDIKIKEKIYEKEKNMALNQIIAGIAHEIRNPLMSIKTFVELIPTKLYNPQFQNHLVEFVPKEVDRVSNLISSLIDYAKPENAMKETVLIKDIIKSSTVLLGPIMENKEMTLNIDIEDGLTVTTDKNKLKQVLINIILNGYESIQEKILTGSEINHKLIMSINAWKSNDYIFIQIFDEGMGMTEDEIKKSTELFYTTKANGTGLGLSLSKQYIEENGGVILIESEKFVYTKITLKFRR